MNAAPTRAAHPVLAAVAGGAGLAALGYAASAAATWARYGHAPAAPDPHAALLDRFLPAYEVGEHHTARVAAPVPDAMAAARALDFGPVARALFAVRGWLLGAGVEGDGAAGRPPTVLDGTLAMGWGVLADAPDALVLGAVCRPWEADPGFRAVPPEAFAAFAEPGLVKIVWAMGADPAGEGACVAWTATRVATTDAAARARFRRYWAAFAPGIHLIRLAALHGIKTGAERPRPPASTVA